MARFPSVKILLCRENLVPCRAAVWRASYRYSSLTTQAVSRVPANTGQRSRRFWDIAIYGPRPQSSVIIAVLLPTSSADRLRRLLPKHELRVAVSWKGLDSTLAEGVGVAMFDPTVNGTCGVAEAVGALRKHSGISLLAYATPTPQNLRAVFQLSKWGLRHVFVYKDFKTETRLVNAIESIAGENIASNLLATVETKLAVLPPRVTEAVTDLFARPSRYETGSDLARQAEIPVKQLYRAISKAGLRPPKQLVACAKTIHGCGYLRFSEYPERLVREKLGYSDPQCFSRQVASVLGCRPRELSQALCSEELLLRLIEWMYKPSELTRKALPRTTAGMAREKRPYNLPRAPRSTERHRPR